MVTVNLVGGARKSFQTDSLEITQSIDDISELLSHLISKKPENTPDFDGKNLLIAVNGVDSSALAGIDTKLKQNDVVNIIPIIHGGSTTKTNVSLTIKNNSIRLFEINKSNSNKEYLLVCLSGNLIRFLCSKKELLLYIRRNQEGLLEFFWVQLLP